LAGQLPKPQRMPHKENMKQNYQYCLNELLKDEGGYTNDPKDPGGPTNFGITLADYRRYIDPKGTATDVKNMTVDQAKSIYKSKYWDAVNADGLPSGLDYTVFDYGVNSGVSRAVRILNKLKSDDVVHTINLINDERLAFLQSLPTWFRFGKGWSNRVSNVRHKSIVLAAQKINSTTVGTHTGTAVIVAGTTTVALTHPHYLPFIIAGAIGLGLVALGIYLYRKYKHA
jgi:lysozyme family protein